MWGKSAFITEYRGIFVELYIIRHAQSENNALWHASDDKNHYHNGRSADPALTPIGRQQAELLAEHLAHSKRVMRPATMRLANYDIHRIFVSPMRRTLETARPVAEALGIAPEVHTDIHEAGGVFYRNESGEVIGGCGMTRDEMAAEFPNYILPDTVTAQGWWKPEWGEEPRPNLFGRAARFAHFLRYELLQQQPNAHIAIIAHGLFNDALFKALFNNLPGPFHSTHYFYNTAITRINISESGEAALDFHNRIEHLPDELMTW
ncbi:MAG: histidine phosphatase family protein [Chloroflexi bacterium]|nr:MAG: histidine phosphatase family protein [Chloroflexota bacterium]